MVRTAAQPVCLETEPSCMWYAAVTETNRAEDGHGAEDGHEQHALAELDHDLILVADLRWKVSKA